MSSDSAGRDGLLELAAEIEEYADAPAQLLNIAAKVRRIALSRQAAQGGEAVGFVGINSDGFVDRDSFYDNREATQEYMDEDDAPYGLRLHALYAAPADTVPRAELNAVKDELVEAQEKAFSLERQLEQFRKDAERIKTVGTKLANAAFNFAQQCGRTLTSDDCSLLDGLRKDFDRAMQEGGK